MLELVLFYFLFVTTYLGSSYYCYILDFYGIEKRQPTNLEKMEKIYQKILPNVLFNILVVSPIYVYYVFSFFTINKEIHLFLLPFELFYMYIGTDILFYTFHRIAHIPSIYKIVHKKHHELTAPIGLGAFYCNPLEMILVNLPSVLLPALLVNIPFFSIVVYNFFATINTVVKSHGGYRHLCGFHDIHHEKFNVNYGVGYFMDKLFNTHD